MRRLIAVNVEKLFLITYGSTRKLVEVRTGNTPFTIVKNAI